MKRDRQQAILDLIEKEPITTQEELASRLGQAGFAVTQATISRDIRDLRLIKVAGGGSGSHYAVKPAETSRDTNASRYNTVLQEAFLSSACAGNLLVIRTVTGMAMAVAASIDGLDWPEIVGSIAGDDTIFLALETPALCQSVKDRLDQMIQR